MSSNVYKPDHWVKIRINTEQHGQVDKLLCTWYGGFLSGEYYRVNSGITDIKKNEDGSYTVSGYSGSTYIVHPRTKGLSMYGLSLLSSLANDIEELGGTLEVVDIEE